MILKTKTILLADDHPLVLNGLKGIINTFSNYSVIAEAVTGSQAIQLAKSTNPDILFIDLDIPEIHGIEILKQVKSYNENCKVAILTAHKEENYLKQAIEAGANGYLLKEFANEEISKCLSKFENNENYYSSQLNLFIDKKKIPTTDLDKLSRTEKKVIRLISQEKSSKEIGEILFISPKTVDNHRSNIIRKLQLESKKTSLFSWATKHKSYI